MTSFHDPRNINWSGIGLIAICATGGTLAISAITLSSQQAKLAAEAPYRLEGGAAFSAYMLVNFFTLGTILYSLFLLLGYLIALFHAAQRTVSSYMIVAGVFLSPCAALIGLCAYRIAFS